MYGPKTTKTNQCKYFEILVGAIYHWVMEDQLAVRRLRLVTSSPHERREEDGDGGEVAHDADTAHQGQQRVAGRHGHQPTRVIPPLSSDMKHHNHNW